MSHPEPAEHWFDRLAARITRREAIRGGVAGAALLSFGRLTGPLPKAEAGTSSACLKGCGWFAHQTAANALQTCKTNYGSSITTVYFNLGLGASGYGGGFAVTLLALARADQLTISATVERFACEDRALLHEKADNYTCITEPNCGGFNPSQKGGPCDGCTAAAGSCCPDQLVVQGYSCCALGCACGTDTGACHGSVTPC